MTSELFQKETALGEKAEKAGAAKRKELEAEAARSGDRLTHAKAIENRRPFEPGGMIRRVMRGVRQVRPGQRGRRGRRGAPV